jgi:tetratricopeptide (TPR) repeat protein
MFLKTRRIRGEMKVRLADSYARLGKLDDAEKLYREALAERESVLKMATRPTSVTALLQTDVGQSRMYLGDLLLMFRKDKVAAAREYADCLEIFAGQLKDDPDNLDLRQRLAATHYRIGLSAADPKRARKAFADCLQIREELAKIDPKDTQSGVELALALARAGKDAEAERAVAALLKQAATDRQVLFQVACALSVLASVTTNPETAKRSRDQAFEVLRDLIQDGWKDRGGLETDPDFDPIRGDARFKELLKSLDPR